MKRLRYLALAALAAFAACDEEGGTGTTDPVAQTGTVTVSVRAGSAGIAGVAVNLAGPSSSSQTTPASGDVSFANVLVGNYVVSINAPASYSCTDTTKPVTVAASATATVTFTCALITTSSISGAVTAGGIPVNGGTVTITRTGGTAVVRPVANGQYSLTGLQSGTYAVVFAPPAGVDCTGATLSVSEDLAVGEAAIINFACGSAAANMTVTIESITVGGAGTTIPADPDSIAARVEVTVNIDPEGADLELYQLLAVAEDGTVYEICRQTFSAGAPAAVVGDEMEITCSWNTDRTRDRSGASTIRSASSISGAFTAITANANRPFHPIYLNGDYDLVARVTPTNGDAVNATVEVTLRNMDQVILGVHSDNTDWEDPTTGEPFPDFIISTASGLRWLSGDVHVRVFPVIFSEAFDPNNPLLARAAFMFRGFVVGAESGVIGGFELCQPTVSGCTQTMPATSTDGTFLFTFCEAGGATATDGSACYDSIAMLNTGAIGAREITLVTKTRFGQFGPGFNAVVGLNSLKSIQLFDQDLASGTRGVLNDVLRIDNEGPVAGTFSESLLPHDANSTYSFASGTFQRSGLDSCPGFCAGPFFGWVNWGDPLNNLVVDPTSDNPFTYPAGGTSAGPDGIIGTGDDGTGWFDPAGDLFAAEGSVLAGIGLPVGAVPELLSIRGPGYNDPSDPGTYDASPSAAEILAGAVVTELTLTGQDLPHETGAGLDGISTADTPFSDTELDHGLAGLHWDRFGNITNIGNFLLLGVDGKAPIYSNATGTATASPADPTTAGTVYDTYDWTLPP